MDAYPEMVHGWCLSRIIHFIAALCGLRYPTQKIFTAKYDYSDAYSQVAHSSLAAIQSIIMFMGIAYIALHLTFGGPPNPPTCWCTPLEMVTNILNKIPLCKRLGTQDPEDPPSDPHAYPNQAPPVRTRCPHKTDGGRHPH